MTENDPRPGVPACGPHVITPACSVDCLADVLGGWAFNPMARALGAGFGPPRTVGDVIGLYRNGRLGEIRGLGKRRIGQIGAGLASAGLIPAPPAAAPEQETGPMLNSDQRGMQIEEP